MRKEELASSFFADGIRKSKRINENLVKLTKMVQKKSKILKQ